MLNLTTSRWESERFLYSTLALALVLLMACLIALIGFSGTNKEPGAVQTSGAVNKLPSAGPPIRAALGERRHAHRRLSVARRRPAKGNTITTEPEAAAPQPAGPASSQTVAITVPAGAAAPELPPLPATSPPLEQPSQPPAPSPPPNPQPAPSPEPAPVPSPEPERPSTPNPPPQPEPAQTPQPAGEVLFKSTFDSGFGGWYVQSLAERASTSSSDPFEGSRAARFEVRQGDVEPDTGSQRSEVSGPTFKEGEDLYIRDAFRVPASNTYSVPWQIIQQLHEEDWNGSPGVAVRLENNRVLELGAGDGSPTFWRGPSLQTDRWYDLVYRVNLSQSSSAGFVEVWLDGARQSLTNGQTRIYGQTMQTDETYLKAGIYRSKSSTGTSIVEHDTIVVGTSLAAVMGN
ncbi:MAG TPA: heparin lyase I family protein [Solirubrobacterales bacterium]